MGLFLLRIMFLFLLIHWFLPSVCNKSMGQCVHVISEINREVAFNVYRDNILTYRAKQRKSVDRFDYISRISMWYRLIAKRILPCPWRNLTKPLGSHLQFRGSHRSFVWQHLSYGLQYTLWYLRDRCLYRRKSVVLLFYGCKEAVKHFITTDKQLE